MEQRLVAHIVMLELMQLPLAHFNGESRGHPCSFGQRDSLSRQEPSEQANRLLRQLVAGIEAHSCSYLTH